MSPIRPHETQRQYHLTISADDVLTSHSNASTERIAKKTSFENGRQHPILSPAPPAERSNENTSFEKMAQCDPASV